MPAGLPVPPVPAVGTRAVESAGAGLAAVAAGGGKSLAAVWGEEKSAAAVQGAIRVALDARTGISQASFD